MSPARRLLSASERARVLRRLLADAHACRILLRADEVETLQAAIELYDEEAARRDEGGDEDADA
ncbi:MAG: hypothetical protein JO345_21815 [Streptosporangiaceae bacterium]|nr:hypothetical protein [Streptosporangiaceae bacterium]